MFRQSTSADGTTTIQCLRCYETRGFRSPVFLARWKNSHACQEGRTA